MFSVGLMGSVMSVSCPQPEPIRLKDTSKALDNIKFFRKQWNHFCVATGMDKASEEVRFNTLQMIIGGEAINFIDCVIDTFRRESKSDLILQSLENYFTPVTANKNVVFERLLFNSIEQFEHEPVREYLGRIYLQAVMCDFTENVTDIIRDRFIAGLYSESLRLAVITSDRINLSLPDIIAFCEESEKVRLSPPIEVTKEILNPNLELERIVPTSVTVTPVSLNDEPTSNNTVPLSCKVEVKDEKIVPCDDNPLLSEVTSTDSLSLLSKTKNISVDSIMDESDSYRKFLAASRLNVSLRRSARGLWIPIMKHK